ncbi:MAG TPA: RNA polymerase sigma factor [Tepidisphaeraceae bacterium]|nr:RNA polymerase sigma factor [Tepidisphaeraceae bacterium]
MAQPPLSETDETLVNRARRGDGPAFEELIRRAGKLVFARLYLETGDAHEAEDLAQETFLIAFRRVGQVADATTFRPWLMSIAHSVVIDAARRRGRLKRRASADDVRSMSWASHHPSSPSDDAARNDECQRVLSILRSMPQEYRQPLTLRYLTGADYETIGRELGLTNGSLRGLLHRGLAMLREQMRERRNPTESRPVPRPGISGRGRPGSPSNQ